LQRAEDLKATLRRIIDLHRTPTGETEIEGESDGA
jgi:hypothetical protein